MHSLDVGPATRRAPFLPLALCYSALEPRPGSQYSPRPLESTQKKTANVKADLKAKHWKEREGLKEEMKKDKENHKAVKEVKEIID